MLPLACKHAATVPLSGVSLWVFGASAGISLRAPPAPPSPPRGRERGVDATRVRTPAPIPGSRGRGLQASFSCLKFAPLLARFQTLDASSLEPSDDGCAPLPPQGRRVHQISGAGVPLVLASAPIGKLNAPVFTRGDLASPPGSPPRAPPRRTLPSLLYFYSASPSVG